MSTLPGQTFRDQQYTTEIERLHQTAAETRLRSVESQIALAFTLCAIAETEIRYGWLEEAIRVIKRVRLHTKTIAFHVNERGHLPSVAVPVLRNRLALLKKRTGEIESSLRKR